MFASEVGLRAFLNQFEDGSWPASQWTHATHIAMGSCYLLTFERTEATERIKHGLYRYHLSQGGQHTDTTGYHETLTLFWIERIVKHLEALPQNLTVLEKVNAATHQLGQHRALHNQFYSWDVLNDREARREWRAPDLSPV